MPCSSLEVNRLFEGTFSLHPQGGEISQSRDQRKAGFACYPVQAGLLLGLFFDPEVGGDIFLRKVG
jgi:hypothetical protein